MRTYPVKPPNSCTCWTHGTWTVRLESEGPDLTRCWAGGTFYNLDLVELYNRVNSPSSIPSSLSLWPLLYHTGWELGLAKFAPPPPSPSAVPLDLPHLSCTYGRRCWSTSAGPSPHLKMAASSEIVFAAGGWLAASATPGRRRYHGKWVVYFCSSRIQGNFLLLDYPCLHI